MLIHCMATERIPRQAMEWMMNGRIQRNRPGTPCLGSTPRKETSVVSRYDLVLYVYLTLYNAIPVY